MTSYAEFAEAVESIQGTWGIRDRNEFDEISPVTVKTNVLFRGHADAQWTLKTTLERFTNCRSVRHYIRDATACVYQLGSFTGKAWPIAYDHYFDEVKKMQREEIEYSLPHLEYLIYLRHHGFPSPLLDWSESAYVALFFAFEQKQECEYAKVCAYIAWPGRSIGYWNSRIRTVGPYVSTHPRHFRQQAQYTYAMILPDEGRLEFCDHMDLVNKSNTQDILVEITIPTSIRQDILRRLAAVNINAYTLYGSEDSLVRSLAMKTFDLAD